MIKLEIEIHEKLKEFRMRQDKEFFKCNVEIIKEILKGYGDI